VLPPPTPEQQIVLDEVGMLYMQHGQWPRWAWVDELLDGRRLDGTAVFQSFPREFYVGYGFLGQHRVTPNSNERVSLTVAGLSHVTVAQTLVNSFLVLLNALGTFRSRITLDPFGDDQPSGQRAAVLAGRTPSLYEPLVMPLLDHEPPTWHCTFQPSRENWESVVLPAELRRFAGVQSVPDYLERLATYLLPTTSSTDEPVPSPFTLPAAIDYLDAVWRLRFGDHFVTPPGVERSARLAFTAASAEEADSRLSALAELLGGLQVPGTAGIGGHPLVRLRALLDAELPDEALQRVHDSIAILDAARIVRVGAQHHNASPQLIAAFDVLGLTYPVADWSIAWQRIQNETAQAFNAIRDELQAASVNDHRKRVHF
jgi:hypothetical protein